MITISFHQKKAHKRAFTLVETIVVLAVFTVVMLALMDAIVTFYHLNAYTIAQAYQVDHARRGVDALVRDMREMTYADNGAFPLVLRESYRIGFYSDIDRDASVEYIEYRLSSTTLEKRIYNATGTPPTYSTTTPESVHTISEYVQNQIQSSPIFVYYDKNGVQATSTTPTINIAYAKISVIVNIDPVRDPGQYMLRSSASLRNLNH